MATVRGGRVVKHSQRFADAAQQAVGVDSFGTYPGHSPTMEQGLDVFVAAARYDSDPSLGNELVEFAIDNLTLYGIDYIIWRQRIFNPEIANAWRNMASRGGPVQDHFDHVHVSFEADAPINHIKGGGPDDMFDTEDRNTLRFLASFAEESKKNACEAGGTDNWHESGARLGARLNRIEARLNELEG